MPALLASDMFWLTMAIGFVLVTVLAWRGDDREAF
ncbi:hypothetical protein SAMN06295910_0005 [Allosphingosinicella indica]|uniref:Uncharacterized protein n=1 Tax=Allosphingosinicella indica TaxID=941907 RepID=A0A1X7FXB0_9SPHN|nr:hypothetical protein SAMN06295910_0005 [Allosphingosinicella indica]